MNVAFPTPTGPHREPARLRAEREPFRLSFKLLQYHTLAASLFTLLYLSLLKLFPDLRWAWPLIWCCLYPYSLYRSGSIVYQLLEDDRQRRLNRSRGVLIMLDVWLFREIVLLNILYSFYLVVEPSNYGQFFGGLTPFIGPTVSEFAFRAYAQFFGFSSTMTVGDGSGLYLEPRDGWLIFALSLSNYARKINELFVMMAFVRSNEEVQVIVERQIPF